MNEEINIEEEYMDKYEQILEDKINAARIEYTALLDMEKAGYDKRESVKASLLTKISSYEYAVTQYRLLKAKGEI